MGKYLDALDPQTREAAKLVARDQQDKLAQKHPDMAKIALLPTIIEAAAESIAKSVTERGGLEDLLKLARATRTHTASQ
jgi:hypothetical protein